MNKVIHGMLFVFIAPMILSDFIQLNWHKHIAVSSFKKIKRVMLDIEAGRKTANPQTLAYVTKYKHRMDAAISKIVAMGDS